MNFKSFRGTRAKTSSFEMSLSSFSALFVQEVLLLIINTYVLHFLWPFLHACQLWFHGHSSWEFLSSRVKPSSDPLPLGQLQVQTVALPRLQMDPLFQLLTDRVVQPDRNHLASHGRVRQLGLETLRDLRPGILWSKMEGDIMEVRNTIFLYSREVRFV